MKEIQVCRREFIGRSVEKRRKERKRRLCPIKNLFQSNLGLIQGPMISLGKLDYYGPK